MISDLLCCFIANLFAKRFVIAIEKYKVDDSLSRYRFELSKLVATSEEKATIMPKTRLHVTLVLALLVFQSTTPHLYVDAHRRTTKSTKGSKEGSVQGGEMQPCISFSQDYDGEGPYHLNPDELSAVQTHCGGGGNGDGEAAGASPPTFGPTFFPSVSPTPSPTEIPTISPSDSPTETPTASPTENPTNAPTENPTVSPTTSPSESPTGSPTENPTDAPTEIPTMSPSDSPSESPTGLPTENPTDAPTEIPTMSPSDSLSESPTGSPTENPTDTPTEIPTVSPTLSPTQSPTGAPTTSPSEVPSTIPTTTPTEIVNAATESPTESPTASPTMAPTIYSGCPGLSIQERQEALQSAVHEVSGSDIFKDKTSPQWLAFQWLLNGDGLRMCPDDEHLLQRYAFAVFYFATVGDEWLACTRDGSTECSGMTFLSRFHECTWGGVTCGPGRRVLQINLGTFREYLCD